MVCTFIKFHLNNISLGSPTHVYCSPSQNIVYHLVQQQGDSFYAILLSDYHTKTYN